VITRRSDDRGIPEVGMPFTAILTTSDPKGEEPVLNFLRQQLSPTVQLVPALRSVWTPIFAMSAMQTVSMIMERVISGALVSATGLDKSRFSVKLQRNDV